ncbi:TonB-dependent receptor domain-containing protein [Flavobacterium sp. I3-2]|uniref:TonB-dependent receptor n=1 Tax=Flavobacterium sp. I3-2 TaxID=2748319 RepID=UPI0015A8B319|nr:TonB-dependent receptor [Flavobacterium sp. I3-2]
MKNFYLSFFFYLLTISAIAQNSYKIEGIVKTKDNIALSPVVVYAKESGIGTQTDENGNFTILINVESETLYFSLLGFKDKAINVSRNTQGNKLEIQLEQSADEMLDEIVIHSKSPMQQVKESAYNVIALDAKAYHNTTLDLAHVLNKASGVRLRETGGVGSDMQLMMDGFNGKHVKVFIDGVPQEGVGSSFGLNNIPINFAERIEVYKGVVPVGFGTDAMGGIINIVTKKNRESWFLDASYSYGSFNTHKSYLNFGQTLKNGFSYEINAFQNYSDNSYYINTPVKIFDGNTSSINNKLIERVKRFHDTYHNEAVVAKVGFVNKSWADRFMVGFTYSEMYKEIQNGVKQQIVFGGKYTEGHSVMPSLEYRKKNILRGLDVVLTANYNKNITTNVDTSRYEFNWYGDKRLMNSPGEQSYQITRMDNNNINSTFTANYRLNEKHSFTFNHVFNSFDRRNRSLLDKVVPSHKYSKTTTKNISGLSYLFNPNEKWNATIFAKYYAQKVSGPMAINTNGDQVERFSSKDGHPGYGIAATYFILKPIQLKASYEKVYRLPTNNEIFGDEDLESGDLTLKPESSSNFNFNLSYNQNFGQHSVYFEGGLIYRDIKDYIQRKLQNLSGGKTGATFFNHGKVETKGYNLTLRYGFSDWLSLGGSFTQMDIRDKVKTAANGTGQASVTYGARIPNIPYQFASSDVNFYLRDLGKNGNMLTVAYDNIYMDAFPLYSEVLGEESKFVVPKQFSHNIALTYSIQNGKYNFTVECANFSDEKLYDNFSLQKAGRAFYGKIRINLGKR